LSDDAEAADGSHAYLDALPVVDGGDLATVKAHVFAGQSPYAMTM
jgi:hypothetical protein